jgi:SAM-dependent methyltransferase
VTRLRQLLSTTRDLASQIRYLRTTGMRTAQRVDLSQLGLDAPDLTFYEAAEWGILRRALPRSEVSPDDVFVDLGAGMGRTLLLASRYPFRRVIGVELAPQLARIARRNLERAGAGRAEVAIADVTSWDVPDDTTVVFMNNPFTGETFSRALEQVIASLERRPRTIRLIYRHPLEHERVTATGCARVVGRTVAGPRWRRAGATVVTYELRPPGRRGGGESAPGGICARDGEIHAA